MPSLAKKLYDEGMEEGRQEGKIEAMKDAVMDLIEVKFGVLEPGLATKIQAANDLDTLQRLRDVIKKSDSMESLLKELSA